MADKIGSSAKHTATRLLTYMVKSRSDDNQMRTVE